VLYDPFDVRAYLIATAKEPREQGGRRRNQDMHRDSLGGHHPAVRRRAMRKRVG
jgi:hypothetical protein